MLGTESEQRWQLQNVRNKEHTTIIAINFDTVIPSAKTSGFPIRNKRSCIGASDVEQPTACDVRLVATPHDPFEVWD